MNASNRTFLGAFAHMLKTLFLTTGHAVNVIDDAVSMADKAVKNARKRQAIDLAISNIDYATKASEEAALRRAEGQLLVQEFTKRSEEHLALYDTAKAAIDAAVAAELELIK
jgi:hypothetical protein